MTRTLAALGLLAAVATLAAMWVAVVSLDGDEPANAPRKPQDRFCGAERAEADSDTRTTPLSFVADSVYVEEDECD